MPNNTVTDLVGVLGQYRILDGSQLGQVRMLQARFTDPRALCKELMQRGWLTPFQVNHIAQGKAASLVLGAYLILDQLGEGAAGQVYKARHQAMNRTTALKVLRKELLADPEIVARFYREIEIASHISHPNIVHAFDAGPIGSSLVLAMEFIDGINLDRLVKEAGRLPVVQACDYIRQAACGLAHAHEVGLIHRDIKPSNLLLARNGDRASSRPDGDSTAFGGGGTPLIKILDMGLARLQQPGSNSATKNLTVIAGNAVMQGTPDYMAPEQALDFHTADIRADIYSLGCTFYFLLAGQPPFGNGTLAEKLLKHQSVPPPPLQNVRKDVPPPVHEILAKMLAKRPPDRYQTPGQVAAALAPLVPAPRKSVIKLTDTAVAGSGGSKTAVRRRSSLKMTNSAPRRSRLELSGKKHTSSDRYGESRRRRKWLVLGGMIGSTVLGVLALSFFLLGSTGEKPSTSCEESARTIRSDYTARITHTEARTHRDPMASTKPQAKSGAGKDFDGKTTFVEVPHDGRLEPAELTVAAWINPASLPDKDDTRRWLVNKNVHEDTNGHYALMLSGKKVGAYLNIDGKFEAWSAVDLLQVNKWQHVAFTYDTFNLRVYYDGREVALKDVSVVPKPRGTGGNTPLVIGRRQDGYDKSFFHGKLDDIRIYNRALTEDEIRLPWMLPSENKPEKGLVFQKRF